MYRIEKTIEVNAPVEECYAILRDFEAYPRFMRNVESVRRKGDPNVWRGQLTGPGGKTFTGEMQVDGMRHNPHLISWHTVRDADLPHSGAITLHEAGERKTLLKLVVDYNPHGTVFEAQGINLANVSGAWLEACLGDFKKQIEELKVPLR